MDLISVRPHHHPPKTVEPLACQYMGNTWAISSPQITPFSPRTNATTPDVALWLVPAPTPVVCGGSGGCGKDRGAALPGSNCLLQQRTVASNLGKTKINRLQAVLHHSPYHHHRCHHKPLVSVQVQAKALHLVWWH